MPYSKILALVRHLRDMGLTQLRRTHVIRLLPIVERPHHGEPLRLYQPAVGSCGGFNLTAPVSGSGISVAARRLDQSARASSLLLEQPLLSFPGG